MRKTQLRGRARRVDTVPKMRMPGVTLVYDSTGRPSYGGMKASLGSQKWWPVLTWAYRDNQGDVRWMTRCDTPGCDYDLALTARRYDKHETCEECRTRWVDGHSSPYIQQHPEITRVVEREGGTLAHYVQCQNTGCENFFWHKLYRIKRRRQCLECDNSVFCEGYPVRNVLLQSHVKKLRKPRLRADKSISFQMLCATQKCPNTFNASSFISSGTTFCRDCAYVQRRLRKFEVAYRALIRRAKQLMPSRPGGKIITYEQFLFLCELPKCFYCQEDLNRGILPNSKTYTFPLIDRLDSKKNYIKGNVAPCCPRCNRVKSSRLQGRDMLIAVAFAKKDRAAIGQIMAIREITLDFIVERCNIKQPMEQHVLLWECKGLSK